MPRGRSLTSPETGAGVWCFFAPMQELTLEHEEMSDAALHRRDQSSSPSSTIHQLVAHQTKAPPPNKRKRLPPFWSIFIDYFFGVRAKVRMQSQP